MRLPPPRLGAVDVGALGAARRRAREAPPDRARRRAGADLPADGDQLDQLLINLVRNAVDAAAETGGAVAVALGAARRHVDVRVRDEGPGLADTRNLFVPFFTTKPNGSGIGLVLSRQIAETHGGTLTLQDRARSPRLRGAADAAEKIMRAAA